jgi:hypothetical protein
MIDNAESATEKMLAELRRQLHAAACRQIRRRHRLRTGAAVVVALLLLAGSAFAAPRILFPEHDMSRSDIDRQITTVVNDSWSECSAPGHCVQKHGSHGQVTMLRSMGVSFVLPDGSTVEVVGGAIRMMTSVAKSPWGGKVDGTADGGTWTVELPGGTKRVVRWDTKSGSVVAIDHDPDGSTKTTAFHSGDVVPLVPGSLDPTARTPEKAVAFDLPDGQPVYIFPSFNETFVAFLPNPLSDAANPPALAANPTSPNIMVTTHPADQARSFGLTANSSGIVLPVTDRGGIWGVTLPDGTKREISWSAGDDFVTVTDTHPSGSRDDVEVPIGHELPLIPFR